LTCQSSFTFSNASFCFNSWSLFNFLFAFLKFTPRSQYDISWIQMSHEFLPAICSFCLVIESCQSFLIHKFLNILKHDWKLMRKSLPFDLWFLTIKSNYCSNLMILNVFRTNLKSDWNSLKLPMIKFPSWVIVVS
jgi:hypothetical protein